jgi:hypothetical protein
MGFTIHPSDKLVGLFKNKPWQGADPFKARFIFVGLDANYAPDVEEQIPEIIDYLNDGPGFWRKTGYHHPFRLPKYRGCGDRYHGRFAEIGFLPSEAEQVSFIELLHLPTVGTNKLQASDLSPEHMQRLEEIFEIDNAKYIFIPSFEMPEETLIGGQLKKADSDIR